MTYLAYMPTKFTRIVAFIEPSSPDGINYRIFEDLVQISFLELDPGVGWISEYTRKLHNIITCNYYRDRDAGDTCQKTRFSKKETRRGSSFVTAN